MTQAVQYNVRDNQGNVYGPATTDMLRQWVREGRIVAGMHIAPEGTEQWAEVSTHPSLSDLFGNAGAAVAAAPVTPVTPVVEATGGGAGTGAGTGTPAASVVGTPAGSATGGSGVGAGQAAPLGNTPVVRSTSNPMDVGYASSASGPRLNTMALLSMISGALSVLAIPAIFCCCIGLVVTGPASIAALVMGFVALRQISGAPNVYTNRWMAVLGLICGVIGLLAVLAYVVYIVIALIAGGTRPTTTWTP
jgi:hypothetical protein